MEKPEPSKAADGQTQKALEIDPAYRITPLGVMALFMPVDTARKVLAALQDRAERYGGDGLPCILFDGGGGTFIKVGTSVPDGESALTSASSNPKSDLGTQGESVTR